MSNDVYSKIPCPACKGRGKFNESMGSRECCGTCRGAGTLEVFTPKSSNGILLESVQNQGSPANRLTD